MAWEKCISYKKSSTQNLNRKIAPQNNMWWCRTLNRWEHKEQPNCKEFNHG